MGVKLFIFILLVFNLIEYNIEHRYDRNAHPMHRIEPKTPLLDKKMKNFSQKQ
jgi:hypothetical protein